MNSYEHDDTYDLFDMTEKPVFDDPYDLLGWNELHEYNPFTDDEKTTIGNTTYTINVSCNGTEPILEKIKRLLFDDPLSRKEAFSA